MSVTLNGRDDLVEPAARVIRTVIDAGDGGRPAQRHLFSILVGSVWGRPELEFDGLATISPLEVIEVFDDEVAARRLRQILVVLEMLRAPQSDLQVVLTDGFALALGGDDEGLRLVRGVVRDDAERAIAHLRQAWAPGRMTLSEQAIQRRYQEVDLVLPTLVDDPELTALLRTLGDLPRGTLGREYLEFYARNGFSLPGDGVPYPAFFVHHDMVHLVAGIPPTGQGEISLSAFQVGMADNDAHWHQLLVSLAAHHLGVDGSPVVDSRHGALEREGAMELLVESFLRGTRCTSNLNEVSLLALADVPIAEVRARFGVEPPAGPFPEVIA